MVVLQETKLAPHAIAETSTCLRGKQYKMTHGLPCQPQRYRKNTVTTHAANEANSGGVAITTKSHMTTVCERVQDKVLELYCTARWTELKVPISGRTKFVNVASYYGISGAASNEKKYRANEELLAMAFGRAIEVGDETYLLCGDINVDPSESNAVRVAVNAGLLVDIGHEWAAETEENEQGESRKIPEITYHKEGPTQGMRGKGSSRIDVILANPKAASAITSFQHRWDLVEEAHVPLQIDLDTEILNGDEVVQKTAGQVECNIDVEEIEVDTAKVYQSVDDDYGPTLRAQIAGKDHNGAHATWNKMAEICTMMVQGEDKESASAKEEKNWWRGTKPKFIKRQKTKPVDKCGSPVTHREREIANLRNKLADL